MVVSRSSTLWSVRFGHLFMHECNIKFINVPLELKVEFTFKLRVVQYQYKNIKLKFA